LSFWLSAHQYVFRVGLLITVIAGLWGLVMYVRKQPASGGYRSLLVITEGVFIVQGLIGIVLVLGGRRPHDGLHWLYGILLVIALPIAATYASGHGGRRESLVYGIAGLFMAGLAIRALTTGA
jgi:heme A synthase